MSNMPDHFSTRQVAEHLNTTMRTVRRWIAEGRLDAFRSGGRYLVTQGQLQRFLERSSDND